MQCLVGSIRSCADAIGQCFITLSNAPNTQWILEADIKSCITFAVKPVGNGPPETEVPVDFGLTQVEFTVSALTPTEKSRSALADFRVEDVPVPEPATLTLFATGALCLTGLVRLRRCNRETT